MYRNSYQRGMLTIFFSVGSKPLAIWDTHKQDGYITRFLDQDIKSMVLEIGGTNVSTTYITCPKGNKVLGITMPFLVMIVKNLKKYFSFEVTILDETLTRRRFRVSNFQSNTQILPLCTVMPIGLSDGWNQIQFNLAEFTRRAYKKQFVEVQKLKINANIRLRRIYFTEKLLPEDQLPPEYKLYFPLTMKAAKTKALEEKLEDQENVRQSVSQQQITSQSLSKVGSRANLARSSKEHAPSIKSSSSRQSHKDSKILSEEVASSKHVVNNELVDSREQGTRSKQLVPGDEVIPSDKAIPNDEVKSSNKVVNSESVQGTTLAISADVKEDGSMKNTQSVANEPENA